MMRDEGRARGWIGEELAAQYLEAKGYRIVGRNMRYGHGELDIICRDGGGIVFVEVKTRRSFPDDDPVQTISPHQEKKLRHTASGYLQEHVPELVATRFDVVGVTEGEREYRIRHVVNALTW